ncbi:MAG TPA: hypothetical protein VH475_01405 [Tepidisphaeraceae bacterium]|jgi:hypothetical protein
MPSPLDFPARGKILRIEDNLVVFNPAGTTYELHLVNAGGEMPSPGPATIAAHVRCIARKVWTMSSGGNFVTPIYGTPRVVQGRVRYLEERLAVVQAGTAVIVNLPEDPAAFDLVNGPIVPGGMINCTILPGATFELARQAVANS